MLNSAVHHLAQRTLLDHQSHDLVQRVGGSHGGELGVGVVSRSDLDDIGSDEVDAFEATDDRADLAGARIGKSVFVFVLDRDGRELTTIHQSPGCR